MDALTDIREKRKTGRTLYPLTRFSTLKIEKGLKICSNSTLFSAEGFLFLDIHVKDTFNPKSAA